MLKLDKVFWIIIRKSFLVSIFHCPTRHWQQEKKTKNDTKCFFGFDQHQRQNETIFLNIPIFHKIIPLSQNDPQYLYRQAQLKTDPKRIFIRLIYLQYIVCDKLDSVQQQRGRERKK